MSEKLIIRNFGPIKDIELELKKFNVIIGENATGKSTVAKVLAVCKYFSYIKGTNVIEAQNRSCFLRGLVSWGLEEFLKDDSYIYYECKDYSIEVKNENIEKNKYPLTTFIPTLKPLSKEFKSLLNELDKIMPSQENPDSTRLMWTAPTSFFQNDVAAVLDNPFYLPTERGLQSIFSLGKSSIQNISDSLFNQFANLDLIAKNFKNETIIEPLRISYKNIDGRGYIKKDNEEKFYSLYNGASGYQSGIPVVLVIKYYNDLRKKKKTFLIEEPELNLFPSAQKELINYLIQDGINNGNTFLLTTHSPYILTSLNNLMYAFEIGQKEPEEANKIINKNYWINPKEVSAYRLLSDGTSGKTSKNIISSDEDGTLIRAEEIDEVSTQLNKEFDKLISLEIQNADKE